jgi:uncharacterized membrane protein YkvA (DUF1232 family)
MIEEAVVVENNTGNLAGAIRQTAVLRGIQLSPSQVTDLVKFVREYVEHAPALLDQISATTKKAGIFNQVKPILEAAEEYFFAPIDVIPDYLGLLGLIDDAYLTHSLVQAISNIYQTNSGGTLLPLDLTQVNQFIRNLIGEPQASMLDAGVATVLNGAAFQQSLNPFLQLSPGTMFDMAGDPDPIWGNASIDEIVDTRLGAMGVV